MKDKKTELIDSYMNGIRRFVEYSYSEGYSSGYKNGTEEIDNLRSTVHREAGEKDEEYMKNWDDNGPFYGWCNKCKHPHSGRYAHIWSYCPWCGGKIDYSCEQPYPLGRSADDAVSNE
jgi:hypothetical protein